MIKSYHLVHCLLLTAILAGVTSAERIPYAASKIELPTPAWSAAVTEHAPAKPTRAAPRRQLLVFSLYTGFKHDVIPHVDRVFQILGEKSGAFETTITLDIEMLMPEKLASYDVLVLNNNCSKGPRRNLLLDELERNPKYQNMTESERQQKSAAIEQSLLEFVSGGKGLVAMHGSPTLLNNSARFTEMLGAAFDYHPPNQEVTVRSVDDEHPVDGRLPWQGPFDSSRRTLLFQWRLRENGLSPAAGDGCRAAQGPGGTSWRDDSLCRVDQTARQRPRLLLLAQSLPRELSQRDALTVPAGRRAIRRRGLGM